MLEPDIIFIKSLYTQLCMLIPCSPLIWLVIQQEASRRHLFYKKKYSKEITGFFVGHKKRGNMLPSIIVQGLSHYPCQKDIVQLEVFLLTGQESSSTSLSVLDGTRVCLPSVWTGGGLGVVLGGGLY